MRSMLKTLLECLEQKNYWRTYELKTLILNILADEEPRKEQDAKEL